MTNIRLLCVVDDILRPREAEIKSALEKSGEAYKVGSNYHLFLKYDMEYRDLASVPWEFYTVVEDNGQTVKDKYMGFGFSWMSQDTKKIWDKSGWAYDCVVYVVAPQNWHTEYAWGWNIGGFWSNYQIQIVKAISGDLWKGFAMEMYHAMDEFVFAETGKRLEPALGVEDFDRDVVHGIQNPPYKIFEYGNSIGLIATLLIDTFEKRAKKQLASLLQLYISLLRQYISYLKNRRPEPLVENHDNGRNQRAV